MASESSKQRPREAGYTVVARRYRPRSFEQLIGQDHISQALSKAITSGRVGHAYLFTGARGVGKTSTARIFAKALNAEDDTPTELAEEIARSIDAGDDMDVIEIDGASNRGIEEIRQLRSNINVRPSRSNFKIYIIDEVHMLTAPAFNALLKTLEEPPAHVKFIFCTTDPDKIPITVLSRCQRFDFAPVRFEAIQARLKEIAEAEGFQADAEALALLARRAAGSMRDSQSLLEQVMSFSEGVIDAQQVHALLGTADEGRLLSLVESLRACDALRALEEIEEALRSGSDPGQLAEQLLNYLRDLMTVAVGGGPELLKLANPAGHARLKELVDNWGMQTVLSAIQIIDEALVRMRSSVSSTTLLEVAMVQICQLEHLVSIPALLDAVMHDPAAAVQRQTATREKKKREPPKFAQPTATANASALEPNAPRVAPKNAEATGPEEPEQKNFSEIGDPACSADNRVPEVEASATDLTDIAQKPKSEPERPSEDETGRLPVSEEPCGDGQVQSKGVEAESSAGFATSFTSAGHGSADALGQWRGAVEQIQGMLADFASMVVKVEPTGSDRWKVVFPPGSLKSVEYCSSGARKSELQAALESKLGRHIELEFAVLPGKPSKPTKAPTPTSALRAQKMREVAEDPFVKKLCEALEGEILRVDPPRTPPGNRSGASRAADASS